ncbi:MAG: zf-HC2 domain-containing protein [Desulfobacteria bacterium]
MDCRETQTLLNAFHDEELPAADRARVEEHLRGCPECGALLADLARADRAAGVPDPGPAYWDRFNTRVMDRVEREADDPGVRVLRPKGGWKREQLRYLVPAAAAAALVLMIVHYGEMRPGAPTPAVPPAVSKQEAPDSAGDRRAKVEPESRVANKTGGAAGARRLPPPVLTEERSAAVTLQERDRLADRSPPAGGVESSRERATSPAPLAVPSPSPVTAEDGMPRAMQTERKKMEGAADRMAEQQAAGKAKSAPGMRMANDQSVEAPPPMSYGKTRLEAGSSSLASASSRVASPCELARTLAERGRIRDADAAQRTCLAGDLDAPSREKGLVFLAELLDRQARFSEADAVIAEVEKRYPQSRPLDLYRQQRPMVQKQPKAVPVTR